ncbi:MAG TPA: branched-chain amino acid ABC transporter permease/ATP-binding protein [Actinomycetota bacterium]|nr:branched-chain amino acid ABC transporter permease/ATP-binding protein [Actinomycetota bacterium]
MTKILTSILLALPLAGAYSMFALGIVVIYRASRILNLAHGAMATLPAYLAYSMSKAGVPMFLVLPLAIASGAVLGMIVERGVLRPLRSESQTTQTVGTVAVLGVLVALIARVWGTAPLAAPTIFPDGSIDVGNSILQYGEMGLALVALIAAGSIAMMLQYTDIGLAMRGAADNRRAASLMGVDPDRTTSAAWALGGALAATAGVLLAGVTNLEPYTLSRQVLPAFVAALLGGLGSLGGALAGAAIVGLVQGVVGGFTASPGVGQLVLTILALGVMALRGKKISGTEEDSGRGAAIRKPKRLRLRSPWVWVTLVVALAWPWVPFPSSMAGLADSLHGDAALAAIFTIAAVSLVVLTGWVGQISLAQASFVGLAAFSTGLMVKKFGIPFPLNLPIAAAIAGGAAALLGVVALRVRGLYLAVATLIFGWMADAYLFKQAWLVGEGGSTIIGNTVVGREGAFPSFDLTQRRIFYYVALAGAALAIAAAANWRDSRTGRAMFAVRGSELAAASMGINVTRTKLFAFAVSGVLAGIAGNLIMIDQRTANADQFSFKWSLFYLAIAAVGGLTRLGGAAAAAALFAALNEIFFRLTFLNGYLELVSGGLLLIAILARAEPVRKLLARRSAVEAPRAMLDPPQLPAAAAPPSANGQGPPPPALEASGITVRFGGLTAVGEASLRVERGETVGLIGPNGAGKTTMFNAIGGMNSPQAGSVSIAGRVVTALGVHERAALGMGRTFQAIQLFKESTVFDNLMVATHLHGTTGPGSHLLLTDKALKDEEAARARVHAAAATVGLGPVLDARCGDLPFGVLRMVEIARALVTGANLILLDEPASGLDERETDRLRELLVALREGLGLSLLIVEHDVRFVMSLSDRMYVLDQGRIIATGTPAEIRSDPAVIAAYLGTDAASTPEPALIH